MTGIQPVIPEQEPRDYRELGGTGLVCPVGRVVYHDPARQRPAYAAKGSKTEAGIDTVVAGADPQWQVLVYYFDTNCDGVIDLVGYGTEGDGKLERYGSPDHPQRLAQLAAGLAEAFTDGTIPYPQMRMCR